MGRGVHAAGVGMLTWGKTALEIDQLAQHLVDRGDDFRICREAALSGDHFDKLLPHIDVGLFQRIGNHFAQLWSGKAGADRANLGRGGVPIGACQFQRAWILKLGQH